MVKRGRTGFGRRYSNTRQNRRRSLFSGRGDLGLVPLVLLGAAVAHLILSVA